MADIRIKDLTTTASSTASDDFIAVDGTTNGTRKLSAFSPTFGGNATVTGTLTVNGTSGSVIAGNADTSLQVGAAAPYQRAAIGLSRRLNYGDALFARNLQGKTASDNYTTVGTDSGSGYVGFEAQYGGVARILLGTGATTAGADVTPTVALSASTSAVSIPLTTASTSTSSGALVVGNGTSGGLGVGGSIYAGDNINSVNPQGKIQIQGTGNTTGVKEINLLRSDGGDACTFGLTGSAYNGVFLAGGLGNNESFIYNAAPFRVFIGTASTNRFDFTSSQFKINPTTASTSTSSGALVVSGGVGVAGAINCGGDITAPTTANITGGRFTSVNSNSYIEQSGSDFNYVTASTRPHVFSIGGTTRFQVTTSGIISSLPASAASLTANSTMTFELTSNTSLKIFVRGSDGTTRSTTLTLA